MKVLEFGNKKGKKIILVHGFQSPHQVWDEYIKHYQNKYHILVPILPGHYPNHTEEFVSFEKTANEFEEYYTKTYGNKVHAIFGMSMGGVFAATLWQNRKLDIDTIIFDGSPLVSFNNLIRSYMVKFYLKTTHKCQKRDEKSLKQAKVICKEEHMEHFLQVLDNMQDNTIINYINDISNFKISAHCGSTANVYFYYGTAPNEMYAKKSAKFIAKSFPNSAVKCFKGLGHCEKSILHPEEMIKELHNVLQNS